VASCKKEKPKDYVTLSGKIMNQNADSVVVLSKGHSKTIKVNTDGTFSDTLKVVTGIHAFFDGSEGASLYLKNGFDIVISIDAKQFDESISYTGEGAEANNYFAAKAIVKKKIFENDSLYSLEKADFDQKMAAIKHSFENLLSTTKNLDTAFVSQQTNQMNGFLKSISRKYEDKQYLATVLAKGNESPKFTDFENFKGGTTSLDDLKGKYVYIDVWATWCEPCKKEIPFLQEVEKAYHGKNIVFVSLSVDNDKNHGKWKEMVTEKQLGGIQLFADNDWESQFVIDYRIKGIPRFVLIDPHGKVLDADAPRPSSDELKDLFKELKILKKNCFF
jgi:thiol-disulfide isomerase/thioredoxin